MINRLIFLFAAAALAACSTTDLHVMTMNVRYDNPADSANSWSFRRERMAEMIASQGVDVLGTQEVLVNQLEDLKESLPDYEAVGVGRADGAEQGEFSAVFFLRDRFTLLDSGTFWLSETPDTAGSKGWDGACERIATWVILRDKQGREFLFINTHLDHMGSIARAQGVVLLRERIECLRGDRAVILTGDFNAEPQSSVIESVLDGGVLQDAWSVAIERKGPNWSFSDFGRISDAERQRIDYIFVGGGLVVEHCAILPDTFDGGYLSDHAPVVASLKFGQK